METDFKKISGELTIPKSETERISKIDNVSVYKEEIEKALISSLSVLMQIILGGAINLNASDIHIEPQEEKTKFRIRIDGMLQDVLFVDTKLYRRLLSRIKLLSGIKLNIEDRPQDGRFSIVLVSKKSGLDSPVKDLEIEVRVSALPAEYGETIVLRILNPETLITLESLGLRKDLFKIVEKELRKPNGMIVTTGPTGSGKTTTLYAFCKKIKKPELKIITIEDPIEYHIQGISQTQVNPKKGYDFASGLKSIMRQDPDVILVGEMRDAETVNTALQAALTGHLVLTTLHTNDAAGVVARLISLGAERANIGPAVNMVIAQRLIRQVCSHCKKTERVSDEELKKIKKELGSLSIDIPNIGKDLQVVRPVGCEHCNFTGYQGRIGIFEIFLVDEEMEKFIFQSPSIAQVKELAVKKGMTTMKQDGFIKALQGSTTIEEVERVAGE